mmetsp:Transcript_1907/g.3308  ORF Transcript_1907/g.3308 Transcript_1907/m.3308 type:complete len:80 (+) Transcript_1907:728-967(+)
MDALKVEVRAKFEEEKLQNDGKMNEHYKQARGELYFNWLGKHGYHYHPFMAQPGQSISPTKKGSSTNVDISGTSVISAK